MANSQIKQNGYILHRIVTEGMETNCYIFGCAKTREVAIIDPGSDHEKIKALLNKEKLIPKFIINTHGHIDHIGANKELGLPVYIHKEDANFLTNPLLSLAVFYGSFAKSPKPARLLNDGDEVDISDIKMKVLHTPGHTPGGISLHYNGLVFTGDALFAGGVGRTDFPYGSSKRLIDSIKDKLMKLPDDTIVLPGHGEKSTIGDERRDNPWL